MAKKEETKVFPEVVMDAPNGKGERFVPADISMPAYRGTRLRRWEVYQVETVQSGLENLGFQDVESIEVTEENHAKLAQYLTTCLAKQERQSLFRPGVEGVKSVMRDLAPEELQRCLKTACELSGVFENATGES